MIVYLFIYIFIFIIISIIISNSSITVVFLLGVSWQENVYWPDAAFAGLPNSALINIQMQLVYFSYKQHSAKSSANDQLEN